MLLQVLNLTPQQIEALPPNERATIMQLVRPSLLTSRNCLPACLTDLGSYRSGYKWGFRKGFYRFRAAFWVGGSAYDFESAPSLHFVMSSIPFDTDVFLHTSTLCILCGCICTVRRGIGGVDFRLHEPSTTQTSRSESIFDRSMHLPMSSQVLNSTPPRGSRTRHPTD